MRRLRRQIILAVVLLTAARLTTYALGKPSAGLANRVYILGLGTVALYALLTVIDRHTTAPAPTMLDDEAHPPRPEPERPTRLAALEDLAAFGADKAQGTYHHLRPYLRDLLAARLAARGYDLDTDPRVPALLGPATWDVVRPDRPPPADARHPGLDQDTVRALTETLERI